VVLQHIPPSVQFVFPFDPNGWTLPVMSAWCVQRVIAAPWPEPTSLGEPLPIDWVFSATRMIGVEEDTTRALIAQHYDTVFAGVASLGTVQVIATRTHLVWCLAQDLMCCISLQDLRLRPHAEFISTVRLPSHPRLITICSNSQIVFAHFSDRVLALAVAPRLRIIGCWRGDSESALFTPREVVYWDRATGEVTVSALPDLQRRLGWTRCSHASFPRDFRAAVFALLCGQARAESPLHQLPSDVLEEIVGHLAMCWTYAV
jgi:hypothetical protein